MHVYIHMYVCVILLFDGRGLSLSPLVQLVFKLCNPLVMPTLPACVHSLAAWCLAHVSFTGLTRLFLSFLLSIPLDLEAHGFPDECRVQL